MAIGARKVEESLMDDPVSSSDKSNLITLDDLDDIISEGSEGERFVDLDDDEHSDLTPLLEGRSGKFKRMQLPDPSELVKVFAAKPRIYIGEFAIVLADKRNLDVYLWSAEIVTRGVHKGRHIAKFRLLGSYCLLASAFIKIYETASRLSISANDGRHIADAVNQIRLFSQELKKIVPHITAEDFINHEVLIDDTLGNVEYD